MKITSLNTSSIAAIAITGLFSLNANASNLSSLDYESYVQSAEWPIHNVSVNLAKTEDLSGLDYESYAQSSRFPGTEDSREQMVIASIDDVQNIIESRPTDSGPSDVVKDLFSENIHAQ